MQFHIFEFSRMDIYIIQCLYHSQILESQLKKHEILLNLYNFDLYDLRIYNKKHSKHRYTIIPRIY